MKIMQINCMYPSGSTGKIVQIIHQKLLNNSHESVVVFGRDETLNNPVTIKAAPEILMKIQSLQSKITGLVFGGGWFSTQRIISIIKSEKPDVVHLHCINAYMVNVYKLLEFLKCNNIPTVVTNHAEFFYTGGCSYTLDCMQWLKECAANGQRCPQFNRLRPKSWFFHRVNQEWHLMNKAFSNFDKLTICSVSEWVRGRSSRSAILKKHNNITVLNGVDTSVFRPRNYSHLREALGLKNEKIVLHVTPNFLDSRKGGKYVLELADKLRDSNIRIVIVGFNGNIKGLPKNTIAVPRTKNQEELAEYYSMADVTVLTSQKETFSMIVAESLCCGTPIVGFYSGGPETIAIQKYSMFVEQGDINSLREAVQAFIQKEKNSNLIAEEASNNYSDENMYQAYVEVYHNLMQLV